MRILHIVSNIGKQSGVMKVVMSYYEAINSEYKFDFLCWDNSPVENYEFEINQLGGRVIYVEKPKLFSNSTWSLFFNNYKYNAVHLHMSFLNILVRNVVPKDTPIIYHVHTDKYSDKKISEIRNRIFCIPLKWNIKYQLACSEAAGNLYFGKKFNQKGHILLNALNLEEYKISEVKKAYVKKSLNIKEQEKIYIHIGGFRAQKNHSFLIDIFSEILKKQNSAKLLLVGEGPLKNKIVQKVVDYGISDKVVFLGIRKDVPELLSISDYCIFPSIFEGLGIVLIESQISNVKTYTSDVIPDEAIISSNISLLSLDQDAKYWSEMIINNFQGTNLKKKYTEQDYNIKNEVMKLQKIYELVRTKSNEA